jgi:hypothetical protein
MREHSSYPTHSKEEYTPKQAAVLSLAWQNMLKRWVSQPDQPIAALQELMQREIETDTVKQINPDTLPFLPGTTRGQDIEEYERFMNGTLTDLTTSYIVTNQLVSKHRQPTVSNTSIASDEDHQQYIDG